MQEELGTEEKGKVSKVKSRNISWVPIFLWAYRKEELDLWKT